MQRGGEEGETGRGESKKENADTKLRLEQTETTITKKWFTQKKGRGWGGEVKRQRKAKQYREMNGVGAG